jgi:D-amino-acid dehydrogenase
MTRRAPDTDVAVIGAGIVGLSVALQAQRRGRSVAVVDPALWRRAASFGNAGVISRGSLFPIAGPALWPKLFAYAANRDPGLRLRYGALPGILPWVRAFLGRANEQAWREAAAALDPLTAAAFDAHVDLAAHVGATDLIARRGYLKLYRTEEAFAAGALEREILIHHKVRLDILGREEIASLEPALTRSFARALFFPESGAVDRPGSLVACYLAAFLAGGGRLIEAACTGIEPDGETLTLHWPGGTLSARQAVLAAGAGSGALARLLGYRLPLAAERGYHRHFRVERNLARAVHDTGGAYVLSPMGDGTVRLLTGVELARPEDPPTPRQLELVFPQAARTLPLGEPVEAEPWCGSRPSTPDGLPVIGRAPRHPNLIFAFGHGHIGLSTGPVTGRIVADLIDRLDPPVPVAPFAPDRWSRA